MPAKSIQQQKLMGLALAYKRGNVPASKVSAQVKKMAKSMTEKDLRKYAGTPHKGLPRKVKSESRMTIPIEELRRIVDSVVADVINENYGGDKQEEQKMKLTPEEKQQYLEAISKFNEYGKSIYRNTDMSEAYKNIKNVVEFASQNIVDESGDWFDKVTLSRHSKKMQESLKLFEKTATEMTQLQQRLEAVYEEIGQTLGRYYKINDGSNEAGPVDGSKKPTDDKVVNEKNITFTNAKFTDAEMQKLKKTLRLPSTLFKLSDVEKNKFKAMMKTPDGQKELRANFDRNQLDKLKSALNR